MKKQFSITRYVTFIVCIFVIGSSHANECYTSDKRLKTSERNFEKDCRGYTKVDCDRIEGLWVCASRNLTRRDSLATTIQSNNTRSDSNSEGSRNSRDQESNSQSSVNQNTNSLCRASGRTLGLAKVRFDRKCQGLERDCRRIRSGIFVCKSDGQSAGNFNNSEPDRNTRLSEQPRFDVDERQEVPVAPVSSPRSSNSALYSKRGSDAPWSVVRNAMDKGRNSTKGYTGQISVIDVNNGAVERGFGANTIENALSLHTVGHSTLRRSAFNNFRRWYQEDGRTQVFRLFPGEENVRNSRPGAARVEAFTSYRPGQSRTWTGRYTIVNPAGCTTGGNCAIFQLKSTNQSENWAFQMNLDSRGNVTIKDNRGNRKNLLSNMIGRSFDLKVIDRNTNEYEVQIDGRTVFTGSSKRNFNSQFRWGMYMGRVVPRSEIMLFVSGAQMN